MCGRYKLCEGNEDELVKKFLLQAGIEKTPGEISPGDIVPVIVCENGKIVSRKAEWGFEKFDKKGRIINARSETVTVKSVFSEDFKKRRCVIPATAFFEWNHKSGDEGKDEKYCFYLEKEQIMYLAGFYKTVKDKKYFVILTDTANEDISDIHTRMPVILPKKDVREYLTNEFTCYQILISQCPSLYRTLE